MDMSISTKGMDNIGQALVRLKSDIPGMVSRIAFDAAGITITSARPTVPRDSGNAARSLRHYLTASGAAAEGGGTITYYRMLELGGSSGRKHTTKRPIMSDGRYIYPGYLRSQKTIQSAMETGMTRAVHDSGLGG